MNSRIVLLTSALLLGLAAVPAAGQSRYGERPPVVVSPDLSAPWVMQLGNQPGRRIVRGEADYGVRVQPGARRVMRAEPPVQRRVVRRQGLNIFGTDEVRTAAVPAPRRKQMQPQMDPIYLPQQVEYTGSEKPGTIVIDTSSKFLYLVQAGGKARRYGVGVGQEGMVWTGTQKISRKAVWPDWRPPSEMIVRERAKGRHLPTYMAGGPENPLGARALYLGSTLYRIHGTNAPWTIGTNVSSGCIRLRNEDVVDLYERVGVGTRVVVI
ncbi:L,D-transpeptidase [Mesorhizobium sp. LHD-90]|uniref:L,D-transpeptidase n=1 Tax=Mesorhizobium sp. LHD-90 TaxID=3071414 RepID=UPI0027E1FFF4|nr:L,D-transpeptidase [Mesorhizobium sp. LHD-90]MDQ6435210.1 L,D-transpeptidase [Mesorhizobium sp. LHD-90]